MFYIKVALNDESHTIYLLYLLKHKKWSFVKFTFATETFASSKATPTPLLLYLDVSLVAPVTSVTGYSTNLTALVSYTASYVIIK